MTFVNPAPMSGYITGDVIDETEINYWCAALPDCMDGAGGGSYTLSAPLIITGDTVEIETLESDDATIVDLHVTDDLIVDDDVTISGSANISGGLLVSQAVSFSLGLTVGDDLIVSAGDTQLGGTLFVSGNTTLSGSLAVDETISGRMLEGGIITNDADQTINVLTYRNVTVPATITGAHTYTLTASGAVDGDWFTVQNFDGTFGAQLAGVSSINVAPTTGVKYVRIGGTWQVASLWVSA